MTNEELDICKDVFRRALTEMLNIAIRAVNLHIAVAEEKKQGQKILELRSKMKVLQQVPQILEPKIVTAQTIHALAAIWPSEVFRAPI